MNSGLNIPLSKTTRRGSWRVVWIVFFIFLSVFIAWSTFRLATFVDKTSSFRPEDTTTTVYFQKTPRTAQILNQHLGDNTLFQGTPFTFSDLWRQTSSQMALHYNEQDLIGVTITELLKEEVAHSYEKQGLSIITAGSITTISNKEGDILSPKKRIQLSAILPNFSGGIITYRAPEKPLRSNLFVFSDRIKTTQSNTISSNLPNTFTTSNNFVALAYFPVSSEIPLLSNLSLESVLSDDAITLIGTDEQGVAIYIRSRSSESAEELALIGEEIIGRQSVGETTLVLPDGSSVSELRTKRSSITSEISAEESLTIIDLENDKSDAVRISKIGDIATITNRKFGDISNQQAFRSSCHKSADYFVRIPELLDTVSSQQIGAQSFNSFASVFSEVGISKKHTFYCW